MIAHHASIPRFRPLKSVREFGLRVAFILLATWPFILAFILLREALPALF
ncbi:hypothetical protein BH20ACT23_BH20ACT23_27090 [soil metagenome]